MASVKKTKAICQYKDRAGQADCPPCSGAPTYRIRNYWTGPIRKRLGPDMRLCKAHAKWLGDVNPCHHIVKG